MRSCAWPAPGGASAGSHPRGNPAPPSEAPTPSLARTGEIIIPLLHMNLPLCEVLLLENTLNQTGAVLHLPLDMRRGATMMNSSLSTRLRSWLASQTWWSRVANALRLPLASRRAAANPHEPDIAAEQIRLLYDQLPSALIATVAVGGLAGYVLWSQVPHTALVLWLIALVAM